MSLTPCIEHANGANNTAYSCVFCKKRIRLRFNIIIHYEHSTVLAACEFTPSSTGDIYYVFQMALTIDSPKITGGEEIV